MFDPETPYNQLPPLPPNCELGTPATLRANSGVSNGYKLHRISGQNCTLLGSGS